jgi:hypothetical protein
MNPRAQNLGQTKQGEFPRGAQNTPTRIKITRSKAIPISTPLPDPQSFHFPNPDLDPALA